MANLLFFPLKAASAKRISNAFNKVCSEYLVK